MTRFCLVRHAEKAGPAGLLSAREPGFGLSAAGREQAERMADVLARMPIRRVLSSPLARARETALATARRLGVEVEPSAALVDIDYGAWTDRTVESLEADETWQSYHRFRSGRRIPDGELLLDVQARVVKEMLRLREELPEGEIALFSHADPIRYAVAWFAGVPLDLCSRIEIDSASLSVVSLDAGEPRIECINRRLA